MKKYIKTLSILTAMLFLFTACGESSGEGASLVTESASDNTASAIEAEFASDKSEMFTDRDLNTETENAAEIKLSGSTAQSNDSAVTVSNNTVNIKGEGIFKLSGELSGSVVVEASDTDKVQIILNGAKIESSDSAAIYVKSADKVVITLENGTQNTLSNGGEFKADGDNNIDGAVFSKADLTFNGKGGLTVNSPIAHGIVCKDDLCFTSGTYTVNSASHGIDANDSVRITEADITVASGKDGIHCENTDDASKGFVFMNSGSVKIAAEGDGISSSYYTQFEGGTVEITTGGGAENGTKQTSNNYGGFMGGKGGKPDKGGPGGMGGMTRPEDNFNNFANTETDTDSTSIKGIKAVSSILINGGSFKINSADDSLHSNMSLIVNGGVFDLSSGDDGVHADEKLNITDCQMVINKSYEGLEALNIKISGGEITLTASDDGINAAGGTDQSGFGGGRGGDMFGGMGGMNGASKGSIDISGGKVIITASGDGLDANGTLLISGGYVEVQGPTQGDTATLDYDVSGIISGGTFIGTGASNMAQSITGENQGVIAVSVGNVSAENTITVKNASGKTVLEFTPKLNYQVFIFSSKDLVKGEIYTLTIGTQSAEFEAQ